MASIIAELLSSFSERVVVLRRVLVLSLAALLVVALAASVFVMSQTGNIGNAVSDFHVGVAFCGNTTAEAKLLIDRVKDYTNLLVVQSGPVSVNETSMNEIVNYATAADLDVIVYFGWWNPNQTWQIPWLDYAKQRWGDRFIGVYLNDEQGGIQLDANWTGYFSRLRQQDDPQYQLHTFGIDHVLNGTLPRDYDDAAAHYLSYVRTYVGLDELKERSITAFTSDYTLYWFDYVGGYDTVLAQFGWNQSITQEIALARGAAHMQNKTWGTIVTWKYTHPPYLDSGEEIYQQMLTAYQAGAKYAVIFNYPYIEGNRYGAMRDEHFQALERLWNKITDVGAASAERFSGAEAVLVLPKNYGWGMRAPDDVIWGHWGPDDKSTRIWELSRRLLGQYNTSLDMVYEDFRFPVEGKYPRVYYWNQTG